MPTIAPTVERMVTMIRVNSIVKDSIVDGPGLRLAVFVQGCSHNCLGCHNPQTHPYTGGTMMTADDILERRDPLTTGLTITGGEPLDQAEELIPLIKKAHALGLNIWLWTGYTMEEIANSNNPTWEAISISVDAVVDGPYIQEQRTLDIPWIGSSNQRVIKL